MGRFVVFLRAVNVGKRQLRMAEARKALEDSGFADVESHIQTGNLLISTPLRSAAKVEAAVSTCLGARAGFDIVTMARTPKDLTDLVKAVDGIPQVFAGSRRYVSFLAAAPTASAKAALEAWDGGDERAFVIGKDVLLEMGVSFAEAKLGNALLEKLAGVDGTARNLTVVRALAEKWGA
jgi:uncharacterized protein (DUF1697 family)